MWKSRTEKLDTPRGDRYVIFTGSTQLSFSDVVHHWRQDAAFRTFFNSLLAASPFAALRWETPPITSKLLENPFEFVLLDSPTLDRRPDPAAFAEHFGGPASVVSFANLGRDALMIVPCPSADNTAYTHLAAFVRQAPPAQQQALWQTVGETLADRISAKPAWLSTAGAGVAWLHVRLDDRPKYYGYAPYRQAARQPR
jgi:hypothetical protein